MVFETVDHTTLLHQNVFVCIVDIFDDLSQSSTTNTNYQCGIMGKYSGKG